jgi:hypothetical protein
MKKNLLLLISFFVITAGSAQVKTGNEPAATKLKRNGGITQVPETTEKNVSVYPNPSTGVLNLSLSGFNGKKTSLSVVNVIGTVVYQETLPSADGKITKAIDMSKFAHGLYYIKLEADDYNEIRKFVLK